MLKLYRLDQEAPEYWETWADGSAHIVHWGTLGTRGQNETIKSSLFKSAKSKVQRLVDQRVSEGYQPVEIDDHRVLLIEYKIEGDFGAEGDLEKRHRLEDRMNESLGWTGLGMCDGGGIGMGVMEVCCLVVDFDIAKQVIADDLEGTEFADYSRIFDERAGS